MVPFIQQSFQLLLDELGIDEKRQFLLLVFAGLVALVVYSVRDRHQHGLLPTVLFTLLGFTVLVFLFTESEAARHWSALVGTLALVGIVMTEFMRRRRSSPTSTADANETAAAREAGGT